MSLQFRRGTAAELAVIVPENGEPIWTTDAKKLFVGDGLTLGGNLVTAAQDVSTTSNVTFANVVVSNTATVAAIRFADGSVQTTADTANPDQALNTTSNVRFNSAVIATTATVAAVRFGDGSVQTTAVAELNTATGSTLGGVKIGSGVNVAADGTISVPTFSLNTATASTVGGVKIGSGVNIAADGTISVATSPVITDQALYTTSSVVFANISATNQINFYTLSIDKIDYEPNSSVYFLRSSQFDPTPNDLQITDWRFLSLNPVEKVVINEYTLDKSRLDVRYIYPPTTATEVTFAGNITPLSNGLYDLGASANRFNVAYVNTLTADSAITFKALRLNRTFPLPGIGQYNIEAVSGDGFNNDLTFSNWREINLNPTAVAGVKVNGALNVNGQLNANGSIAVNTATFSNIATFDGVNGTAKAVFTGTGVSRSVELWNESATTTDFNAIRFFRKRGSNTLLSGQVMGAVQFDGFQTTNGYGSDYSANRLFPGMRMIAATNWSQNSAPTRLQFINRSLPSPPTYPYSNNALSTDTNSQVVLDILGAFQTSFLSQTVQMVDPFQGFNNWAGTQTNTVSGVFYENRFFGNNGGNLFSINLGSGNTAPLVPQTNFKVRTDHIPYWFQGQGGLSTSTQGQVNWIAGSDVSSSNSSRPSIVKGSTLNLNSVRYAQLDRTVTRGSTTVSGNLLWGTSTQAGDVLGTVSFQGGLTGSSDVNTVAGGVDGVLIRAYAKNDWDTTSNTSTNTSVTLGNIESALRFEITTSTTIGGTTQGGLQQLYKTVFEIDTTTATFFTQDIANNGIVQRNAYVTTSTTDTAVLATFNTSIYPTAKFSVSVVDNNQIHYADISVIGDGTDAWKVEYGINTSDGALGTFSLSTSSSSVNLLFTPTAASAMKIRVQGTLFQL